VTAGKSPDRWPTLLRAARHGFVGEYLDLIEPHTESDPAAVLFQLLAAIGNAVGRAPYFVVEQTRHYPNLFVAIVGDTAKGRKGTAARWSFTPVEQADPSWNGRHVSGLNSGEGLIHAVRDAGEGGNADPGVGDKRLFAIESELASVLKRMGRDGNTLSAVLRQAWDGGLLQNLTRSTPLRATGAHVSVSAHITSTELQRHLDSTEIANGMANRFLWVLARRSKLLPEGGSLSEEDPSLTSLITRLGKTIALAKTRKELKRTADARTLWASVYGALSDGRPGLFGAITSRAEAQVLRLSLLYALLDDSATIDKPHLEAALAAWAYCSDSAFFTFRDAMGDPVADAILSELRARAADGMSRTEISNHLGRHYTSDRLDRALRSLEAFGLAYSKKLRTGGAPMTRWYAKEAKEAKKAGVRPRGANGVHDAHA
jgi:hypothetical protein